LTFLEGLKMLHRNRNVLDPIGWTGEFFEQLATYLLSTSSFSPAFFFQVELTFDLLLSLPVVWPSDGVMTKEDWRTVYDVRSFRLLSLLSSFLTVLPRQGSIFFTVAARERQRRSDLGLLYYFPILPGLFKENRAAKEPNLRNDGGKATGRKKIA
jgi:hypothetical protein